MAPNSPIAYFDEHKADFDIQKQMMITLRRLLKAEDEDDDRLQNPYTGSFLTVPQFHKYMTDFQDQIFNSMRQFLRADEIEATEQNPQSTNSIPADEAFSLSSLPFHIWSQIFLKLSFKSIRCCMLVCKPWRRLLSHSDFVQLHLAQSHTNQVLIRSRSSFCSIDYQLQLEEQGNPKTLEHPSFFKYTEVFGSCNGLVCLVVSQVEKGPVKIVLWNPSIGDYKLLPYAHQSDQPLSTCHLLRDTLLLVGLGYDTYSDDYDDYILVRVRFRPDSLIQPYIYSLKTDSWRVIEPPTTSDLGWDQKPDLTPPLCYIYRHQGTCINGEIFWLLYDQYYDSNAEDDAIVRWIVGFNLKDEKFFKLPLWDGHSPRTYYDTNILVIEESLGVSFLNSSVGNQPKVIEFWKHQHCGWTKLYNIPLCGISEGVEEKVHRT